MDGMSDALPQGMVKGWSGGASIDFAACLPRPFGDHNANAAPAATSSVLTAIENCLSLNRL